jgi:hypothetical protein
MNRILEATKKNINGCDVYKSSPVHNIKGLSKWTEIKIKDAKLDTSHIQKSVVESRILVEQDLVVEDVGSDDFVDKYSEDRLLRITKSSSLSAVNKLELFGVDTCEHSITQVGERLPNLRELTLTSSFLSNGIRDLGTSLKKLRVLVLCDADIEDLDGIGALLELRKLYLSKNKISNLTPLALHDSLEVLVLDHNCISDVTQISQLGTCMNLTNLNLNSNPITKVTHKIARVSLFTYKYAHIII